MAKNQFGFIQKRYKQPIRYREIFLHYNAIYKTVSGKDIMIEARTHFLRSEPIGADIESYDILLQEPDCRRVLRKGIKSQKQAIELLEKFSQKY